VTLATAVAPASYDELAERYSRDIKAVISLCLRWAKPYDREDVYQYILGQFVANDVIAQYKPGHLSERTGQVTTFRAFILAKVRLYCHGKSDALLKHYGRELSIADVAVGDGTETWIASVTDGDGWDTYPSLADSEVLDRLRAHLAACPPREGQPGLLELFDELAGRVAEGRPVTEGTVRRQFGMDQDSAAAYLAELRAELRAAVAHGPVPALPPRPVVPTFDVDGTALTEPELKEAITLLKEATGNQVLRTWDRAGHPLAARGKDWYVPWAKAELAWFPALRGTKGGHYAGGHGSPVKRALIHRLERVLSGEGVPDPAAPAARPAREHYDELEAALWKMPGATPARVDAALAAARSAWA
jgi:hypothetical protein